ncbi:imidazole glycerol phosphate synthase subunit HisH [Butyrivibrio sp. VCB2001]|uniref:imidazole glycerol phosphate synthase subunit HisH n=1 Tax=Butyrivibrio sp. VCB2001 TaxID=1280667 RepID=UPI0004101294|nr:imidazole glycerol phosphate synthase subunit HisH [Butyrivibrio sp. VCB2001]
MIGIIDYGLGNLGSIKNMLKIIGEKAIISSDISELDKCNKLILPGVGAFDAGMSKLNETGLAQYIKNVANMDKKPILGICLGMQLLGKRSEEGQLEGLGLIPFESNRFQVQDQNLKVPHMGWDIVDIKKDIPLTHNLFDHRQRYYFVHSYHAVCESLDNVMMTCDYGYEFAAAVVKDNIMGVQFHPEKSHSFGMNLLENFVKM